MVLAWILLPGLPGYLEKPLISEVWVDGSVQNVEYEALPTVCFSCGKYGHVKELCPMVKVVQSQEQTANAEMEAQEGADGRSDGDKRPEFGPWMLVECKARRGQRGPQSNAVEKSGNFPLGSRYLALN